MSAKAVYETREISEIEGDVKTRNLPIFGALHYKIESPCSLSNADPHSAPSCSRARPSGCLP